MSRTIKIIAAFLAIAALSGCVVEPGPGPRGWCYNHPYRC
jgi:hypothetical protein